MGAGLVGDHVRAHAAPHQLGQYLGGIAAQRHRHGATRLGITRDAGQRVVHVGGLFVDITGAQAEVDAGLLAFDRQRAGAGQRRRQRLRAAHAAQARGQHPAAGELAVVMLAPRLDEGLVGALHDALAADVDPTAGGHLPIHGQAFGVEFVEMLPGGPMRHQVGICDQYARRVGVGLEHAYRLARLHQQGLVVLQALERLDDLVVAIPIARGAADAAIDHQFLGILRDVRIEIVHQHAQRRLGQPALGGELVAARRADLDIAVTVRLFQGGLHDRWRGAMRGLLAES